MNPDINNIQYHDGVHRFLPPSLRRPLNSPLTSTLEVITSKEFVKDSCVHRSDVKELHNTANEYGQCVICISVMSENRTTLDMVVRDRAMGTDGVGILREDGILPPFLQPTYIHLRYKPCE